MFACFSQRAGGPLEEVSGPSAGPDETKLER